MVAGLTEGKKRYQAAQEGIPLGVLIHARRKSGEALIAE
jgi:hypothetical protein